MCTSKADLELYLTSNNLPTVLVDMVENLLLNKPSNPHGFIVNYIMERFPDETSEVARFKLSSHQSISINSNESNNPVDPTVILNLLNEAKNKESEDEDSIDDESDEESDDELSQPPTPPSPKSLGHRRTSVCGERQESIMNDSSSIPNNPKLEDEYLEICNAFKKNVLFKHLDEEQLNLVQSAMSLVTKKKGDVIIKEGDDGDNFYVVKDGTVDVFKQSNSDKTHEDSLNDAASDITRKEYESMYGGFVIQYPPGESFGELAILYNAPRAATCIASSHVVELWALDRISFKKILMSTAITKRNVRAHFLQRVSIFSQLNQQEIFSIADFMEEECFKENEVIFNEGDAGRKFYIIKEGNANCVRSGDVVAQLEKGAYFGEIALITSKPRQATVVAKSEVLKCLTVDRKTFVRVMGPLQDILIRNMEAYKSDVNYPCAKVTGHYSV